ncbi:cyclin-dependent kinase 2-interacting protein isoform X2 [Dunckerocampus dactyliophorus]|uniref:cyclin-dependent kinase 2-interacting protein isoform X2 n=1 Tax=Dunckerocampus dactyliophorus TaxID=161453 RepID=UPI002407574F|nr:cyclin-dependent kinase 2-interacting protein isoform X2 [Dunckerocampus dactyliophorus]
MTLLLSGDVTNVTLANRKCPAVTGSARKIKDNGADWHNLMLRWEKLNDEGFTTVGNIVNVRLSGVQTPEHSSLQHSTAQLHQECCKLQDIIHKMAIVAKMQRLMASQQGLMNLEEFQFGPEGRKVPLFHTWSTKQFDMPCSVLLDTFSRELQLKQTILHEVAHSPTSDLSMVYLSCWLHQPFMAAQSRVALEAMLLETGHRPL